MTDVNISINGKPLKQKEMKDFSDTVEKSRSNEFSNKRMMQEIALYVVGNEICFSNKADLDKFLKKAKTIVEG